MKTSKLNLKNILNIKKKEHLSSFDLLGIYKLLQTGFSFKESLDLLKNNKNNDIFFQIDERLKHGELIEDFFVEYLEARYVDYFATFIKFESFVVSLGLAIEIVQDDLKQKKLYLKNLTYPLLILVVTVLGIYLFNIFVFPNMIEVMSAFSNVDNGLLYGQRILNLIINIILMILIIILITFLYFKQEKNQVKGFTFFQRLFKQSFIHDFVTNDFVRFFYHCQKKGLSTLQSMKILCNIPHKPLVSYVARNIDERLVNGEMMENAIDLAFLDHTLYKFMIIAINTAKIEEMLLGYMEINALKVEKKCKKLSRSLQIISYLMLGIMLVFVYQILLMPLGIISNI